MKKFLLIIKMLSKFIVYGILLQTAFFTLIFASEGTAQRVSVKEVEVHVKPFYASLYDVVKDIERQTVFKFAYSSGNMKNIRNISLVNGHRTVYDVLLELSQKNKLKFKQVNKNISIDFQDSRDIENQENFLEIIQTRNITGKVTSQEDGLGLPGVNVIEKGTSNGTVTDVQGNYALLVSDGATIVFSSVGFTREEVLVGNQSVINLVMVLDIHQLQELVVIGYGTAKREDLTGAISSISSEKLEKHSGQNLTQVLRGAIPGLDVGLSTSAKGIGSLLVRGKTSLKANNSPLIVLDGIIYTGDLADINPADIESIDVLKDASSAAVYGSRAASGVVIISSKTGRGEPRINFNMSTGFSNLKDRTEKVDVDAYLNMRAANWESTNPERPLGYYRNPNNLPAGITIEQWRNYQSGINALSNEEVYFSRNQLNKIELENYLAGRSVDWYDAIFRTGLRQDYNVSISGASDNISYYYSLGYLENEGFYTDESFKNVRTRLKLESNVTDFMKVGINTQYAHRDESPQFPRYDLGINMSPLGSMYHPDGTLKFLPHDDSAVQNPFYYRNSDNYAVDNVLMGNIYADVDLPLGFTYRINWINQLQWDNAYNFGYTTSELSGTGAVRRESNLHQWFLDHILSWNKVFGINRVDLTLLYNAEQTNFRSTRAENSMFDPSELLGYHQLDHGTIPRVGADDWVSTAAAMMARVNYSLLDRYLFTASFRRDGYSAFGVKNPYASFPSVAVAWRLSDENFFNVNLIDFLKLRLSYGVNGNRDVSTYAALQHLGSIKYIYNVNGGKQSVTGFAPTRMANPELRWERTAAWNAGVDFSVVNGKLSGSIDAYSMLTNDLILDRRLPVMTGYVNITSNMGAVANKGLELSLISQNVKNINFDWSSQVLFSMNRNEIKELYGDMEDILDGEGNVIGQRPAHDYGNNWFIGHDIDRIWDYKVAGFWQLGQEDEAKLFNARPGDIRLVDQNEDGKISPREDKVFLGYSTPRHKFSFINNFTLLKNIDLSFLVNVQLGRLGENNNHIHSGWQYGRMGRLNYPYWTPDNPTNEWGRLNSNNAHGANYYISRSFVRLQNFSLGYRVPETIAQRFNANALRFSFELINPWVSSPWDLWDPETAQPTPMIGTFNVRLTL